MKTASIIGLETEYAALSESGPLDPRLLFSGWQPPYRAVWDDQPERPWNDARGFVPLANSPSPIELPLTLLAEASQPAPDRVTASVESSPEPVDIQTETPPDVVLANGARFYLDHTHPEWSTPECATPAEVVAYDKAGEVWLNDLVALINQTRRPSERVSVYKNNVDVYGNTYGCHENYLVDAEVYTSLFDRQAQRLYTALIPFLVTRQVVCGAGKVAPLDSSGTLGFHISQRADFFESLLGLQTTHRRPLINTRDEPHADPLRFRRLHVIVGDANLAEYSTYLKVGSTALVLEMLAADRLRLDLTLADPLAAVRAIAGDPTCRKTVELEAGNRHYTAVDIQHYFVEAAGRYLDERCDESYRRNVWKVWSEVVDDLATGPEKIARKIDWAIKYWFFKIQMDERGWTWATPQVRELDIKYHKIDPERSLFHVLQSQGFIERLLTDRDVRLARSQPPAASRARLRVACLNRFADQIAAVNWDSLVFTDKEQRTWRWRLADPTDSGPAELDQILDQTPTLAEFARAASLAAAK